MKPYRFDPRRLRAALAEAAARFAADQVRQPLGLDALFRLLEKATPEELEDWSHRFLASELDLLCHFYNRGGSVRTLIAIVVVLAHRGDRRCRGVMHLLLHQLPDPKALSYLKRHWRDLGLDELHAGSRSWISSYMEAEADLPLIEFISKSLEDGRLSFEALETGDEQTTPLFIALLDFLFTRGQRFIPRIQPQRAAAIVADFLARDDEKRVAAYLNHFPESHWDPELMEELKRRKGAPDPHNQPFYQLLEQGRLWVIRRRFFERCMHQRRLAPAQQDFWQAWSYRCQDFGWEGETFFILVRPLRFEERADETLVRRLGGKQAPLRRIPHRENWKLELEKVLEKNLGWTD